MLFEAGALEVHVRVSSPPIVSPCFYGIDMANEDELIAAGRTVEEVREEIGATSLAYLSLEGLQEATRRPAETFCRACLTSDYPTRIPEDARSRSSASSPRRPDERRPRHTPEGVRLQHAAPDTSSNRLAFTATAHCLTGCAIGESSAW